MEALTLTPKPLLVLIVLTLIALTIGLMPVAAQPDSSYGHVPLVVVPEHLSDEDARELISATLSRLDGRPRELITLVAAPLPEGGLEVMALAVVEGDGVISLVEYSANLSSSLEPTCELRSVVLSVNESAKLTLTLSEALIPAYTLPSKLLGNATLLYSSWASITRRVAVLVFSCDEGMIAFLVNVPSGYVRASFKCKLVGYQQAVYGVLVQGGYGRASAPAPTPSSISPTAVYTISVEKLSLSVAVESTPSPQPVQASARPSPITLLLMIASGLVSAFTTYLIMSRYRL